MKHPEATTNTQFSINKSIYLLLNLFIFLAFFSCHNEPIKQDNLPIPSANGWIFPHAMKELPHIKNAFLRIQGDKILDFGTMA